MKKTLFIISLILILCNNTFSQKYTEYYFKFKIQNKSELDTITRLISIDNVKGLDVFAYANQQELDEFQKLSYKIEFLQKDIPKSLTMATTLSEMYSWDRYPTYEVYRQMMKKFETNYPSICKLDSIGTTNNGRQLYVLKISDQVDTEENEPEFFYTSTMHGDETTGFILMLRLADSLLSRYGSEPEITNLVNEIEIYINPNSNPDGTYYGGNNTVSGAIRSNGYADLNRDFPDPRTGANSTYQLETQAMMDFAEEHHFIMSANFHGGAAVMNYPWDTWYSSENPHADTDWFEQICTDYVTTARTVYSDYMKDVTSDGVTQGADWYKIDGGRQDYMNFWHQCREVTIEISTSKLLATESLNNYWNYNKESLLNFMNECLFGIRGTVTDSEMNPLDAMIWIIDHDSDGDSSMVFTDPDIGDYHRLIEPGTYDIVASSEGFLNDTAKNVIVTTKNVILLDFKLILDVDSISLKTDPAYINDSLFYNQIVNRNIVISNDSYAISTTYNIEVENQTECSWLEINKNSGTLSGTENDTIVVTLNSELLSDGYFSANILLTSADFKIDTIPVYFIVNDTIGSKVNLTNITDTLNQDTRKEYPIIITNIGNSILEYSAILHFPTKSDSWINLDNESGSILPGYNDTLIVIIDTKDIECGNYACELTVYENDDDNYSIPIDIYVNKIQSIDIKAEITEFNLYPNPFNDQVNIEFFTLNRNRVKLSLFNICGNLIFQTDINSLNNTKNEIFLMDYSNLTNLPAGIYFIQLSISDYQITKKLIKQ